VIYYLTDSVPIFKVQKEYLKVIIVALKYFAKLHERGCG